MLKGPRPDWANKSVSAFMSTRVGGVSTGPWHSLNLSFAVGDAPEAVAHNRALFAAELMAAQPVFMQQVHGAQVVELTRQNAAPQAPIIEADACWSTTPGLACTITVADCLPVLFAAQNGRAVGAAHAGWRGLATGVLQRTAYAVSRAAQCAPQEVQAWLGPCIGPTAFEVGADVRDAFDASLHADCFEPTHPKRWLANLPHLARHLLTQAGCTHFSGGTWCTVREHTQFFSFRREGVTGRMAAAVWIV